MRRYAERLHRLIRDAFDQESLERTLLFRMNERLDAIASHHVDFETVVFRLVLWADQHGRLLDLVAAAATDRPQRADLASLRHEMETGSATDPSRSAQPAANATKTDRLPNYLAAFIRAYERLLRVMPENEQRTVLLEEMVTKIREFDLEPYDLPPRFHLSDSAGERLASIVALRQKPKSEYLHWLSERLAVEYAFAGYHAAAALLEAARSLPVEHLDGVADAVESASSWVADVLGRSGRRDKLNEAKAVIIQRR